MKQPLLLMILDGFGIGGHRGNAIESARTPHLDRLFAEHPTTKLGASGGNVGLPDGQMGNSEVGRITKAINDGDFFENEAFQRAMDAAEQPGASLHLMGLLSDGGVHSHNAHLYALVELAKRRGISRVYVHAFLDGRDVPPSSALEYVTKCEEKLHEIGVGKIATVTGRYYAMDRDNRWERVEKAYNAMVNGTGNAAPSATQAVQTSYDESVTDEFVLPTVCCSEGTIRPGDAVVFFNFRPDRAREITRSLVDPAFTGFARSYFPLTFVCMTQYDAAMPGVSVAFAPQSLKNTLGEYLSAKGMTQLRIAETEKYAHVTFFFNGGVETVYPGEDRLLIPSPKVATYDEKPEMSAYEVTDALVPRIESGTYDVIVLNFANCDMVGHTGVFDAAVKAVEAVDTCVGRILAAMEKVHGVTLLTADHGNADQMLAEDGTPFTAHTTNPVPFCVAGYPCTLRSGGMLADIAPTMLQILGLPQPPEMTGASLLAGDGA